MSGVLFTWNKNTFSFQSRINAVRWDDKIARKALGFSRADALFCLELLSQIFPKGRKEHSLWLNEPSLCNPATELQPNNSLKIDWNAMFMHNNASVGWSFAHKPLRWTTSPAIIFTQQKYFFFPIPSPNHSRHSFALQAAGRAQDMKTNANPFFVSKIVLQLIFH